MAKEKKRQSADLGVLAGDGHPWEIEGRLFEQKTLKLRRLSKVMEEVISTIIGSGRTALLDQLLDVVGDDGDITDAAKQTLTPVLTRLVVQIPAALPKVCALILEPETKKVDETEEYLGDHMTAREGVAVIKLFIEQNEIGELVQDFFGLMGSVRGSLTEATKNEETDKERIPKEDTPSDSESTTTEDE